ncbi:MAG: preprotein translocase subunit SecE [Firmicutes bacterium]|nr:preprotein translocase subunit SecE [Bacillota bacterium]
MAADVQPKRKSIWARIRDMFGELKKVTWPTVKTVLASTSIVIAVAVFFLILAMGVDGLFGYLYDLLTKGIQGGV